VGRPQLEFGDKVEDYPLEPTDLRLWIIMTALRRGVAPQDISTRTGIDVWFIEKMKNIVAMEKRLLSEPLTASLLLEAKQMGFSDEEIGTLADKLPDQVRNLRKLWQITPVYKMVDTCAGEFEAQTPYFYSTYDRGENEAPPLDDKKAMVIGSGPIRIGQGIEFDYCSVHSAWALREEGWQSIMVNSNPETVSTDFDTSDRLYFEALDKESLQDIAENESEDGVELPPAIVQFGGQTAINVAGPLYNSGIPISGSSIDTIDLAEDRRRFEAFINRLGMQQAPGATTTTVEEAIKIADLLGYPVLVRPSYVLGGRAMEIVHNPAELTRYMKYALDLNTGRPVLIDKFLQGKEVEIDAVADGSRVFIPGIMEHIERAGVHSGDSIAVYPPKNLTEEEINTIVNYSIRLGLELGVKGLMNIQFAVVRNNSSLLSMLLK